jgi:glycosyltransferase involved in cell wall biosynthesis
MNQEKISFIIPAKNEESTIRLCLEAILNEMIDGDQLIVVDNGSTDKTIGIVKSFPNIHFLDRPDASVGRLRNEGARIANGEVLGFIDADCVIGQGWRDKVIHALRNPNVAVTGAKCSLPEKPHWIEKVWYSQRKRYSGEVKYINSGNLAVIRDIFFQVGGFDESLITGEDAEFCWRLRSYGFLLWEDPDIIAVHYSNPKDIYNFYKKERWHGLGMFGTFKIFWFDKPVIMTFSFVLCCVVALFLTFSSIQADKVHYFFIALLLIFFVPGITAIFRCLQFKHFNFFPQYLVLYTLYYIARSDALLRIVGKKVAKSA